KFAPAARRHVAVQQIVERLADVFEHEETGASRWVAADARGPAATDADPGTLLAGRTPSQQPIPRQERGTVSSPAATAPRR
ncbi:MAG TPA: hypothetical protein VF981_05250, partial [Gemmatimonadaceae bacterium]